MQTRFPTRGIFVTGTDTEVGKTYVASLMIEALLAEGYRVGAYKPAASGGRLVDGECICEDAEQLWRAAREPLTLSAVCPQMFLPPLAPDEAARQAGTEINRERLVGGLETWRGACDVVVVEGAGGYLSPIAEQTLVGDLAIAWGYPVLIVAANRLGTINQTLQTLLAVTTYRGGAPVAGVVLNDVLPRQADVSQTSNWQGLERHCPERLLTRLRHGQVALPTDRRWSDLLGGAS